MKTTPAFTIRPLCLLVSVMAFSLTGCEYWPPALLTQLEQLRTYVQDLSDERAELEMKIREATLVREELQEQVEELARENESLRTKVARLEQTRVASTSRSARKASARATRTPTRLSASASHGRTLYVKQPWMHGKDVRAVQQSLKAIGVPVTVDGYYGADTRAAVVWFQRKHGLRPDGVVGPGTRSALSRRAHEQERDRTVRLRKPHMHGSDVKSIQKALRHAGVSIKVDGTYGSDTRSAVKTFQRRQGLRADGVVGPATREALGLS